LVVDADAVLSFAVALEGLEPVSRQSREIAEHVGRFEPIQLHARGAFDARESFYAFPATKSAVRLSRKLTIMKKL
jgi:hypothetical protein